MKELRQTLWSLLGDLPNLDAEVIPSGRQISSNQKSDYREERWLLDLNGEQEVPAILLVPNNASKDNPLPAVLYNHAHGGNYDLGKEELLQGRKALPEGPWGEELISMGFIVICIDHWAFGERNSETESAIFKRMIWMGQVLWGRMIFDNVRALDWLVEREEVDSSRIATMGISMGSTMAWWHSALDDRIGLCIDLCCLTDFDSLVANGGMDGHGIYYYVPDLLLHASTSDICSLIAPRMHLSCAGLQDSLTPPDGLERVDVILKQIYSDANASENWLLHTEDVGHIETPKMRELCKQWLSRI